MERRMKIADEGLEAQQQCSLKYLVGVTTSSSLLLAG